MKKIIPIILFLLISSSVNSKDIPVKHWPYYRNIQSDFIKNKGPVAIQIDNKIYHAGDIEGLRILDSQNREVPYFREEAATKIIRNSKEQNINISSSSYKTSFQNKNFFSRNMMDAKLSSYFEPDYSKDKSRKDKTKTTIQIRFSKPELLSSLTFLSTQAADWDELSIYSQHSLKFRVRRKNEKDSKKKHSILDAQFKRQFKFREFSSHKIKIVIKYKSTLKINSLEIHSRGDSKLYFGLDPKLKYRLYYGHVKPQQTRYTYKKPKQAKKIRTLKLSSEIKNHSYLEDIDGDYIYNPHDNCPFKKNSAQKDRDQDGIGDVCDLNPEHRDSDNQDSDQDGVGDLSDNCSYHKNPKQEDSDFNGIGDACDDSDDDGIINSEDNCPKVANANQQDLNNNKIGDRCEEDLDQDGIIDLYDNCPSIKNKNQKDSDQDGHGDACDNCPQIKNVQQQDSNQDGIGDYCEDEDSDQIPDSEDNCIEVPNTKQEDQDGDGIGDSCDNCPTLKNPRQEDLNKNKIGDICEDKDQDGIYDYKDNCPNEKNPEQHDQNKDGIGDACLDTDQDHVIDSRDNCPKVYNYNQKDIDQDGLGNACDDSDDRITEKNNLVITLGVIVASLFLVIFVFRFLRKIK